MTISSCESLLKRAEAFESNIIVYDEGEILRLDEEIQNWIEDVEDMFLEDCFHDHYDMIASPISLLRKYGSFDSYRTIIKILTTLSQRKKNIFISFYGGDNEIADQFKKMMEHIVDRKTVKIFKANDPENGTKLRENINESVRKRYLEDLDFICLISDGYMKSAWCMNEVGAAWGGKKRLFKILLPGFEKNNLKGVLKEVDLHIDLNNVRKKEHDNTVGLKQLLQYFSEKYYTSREKSEHVKKVEEEYETFKKVLLGGKSSV